MQYALVNGQKMESQKGLKGLCPACENEVIPKCGEFMINHWAHKRAVNCDSWWEPETQWHRDWKNQFPPEYREVILWDETKIKFHRADIYTKSGVTIEFQNSPLQYKDLKSREEFYPKLIWVVNIQKWKERFSLKPIPNPYDELIKDFDFVSPENGLFFYHKAELNIKPKYSCSLRTFDSLKISNDHFLFNWKNRQKVWFLSKTSVFLDLGDDFLYFLKERKQIIDSFSFIHRVKKAEFISKYSN